MVLVNVDRGLFSTDVAVGAPFEENGAGSGAVYIYHGTSEGVEATYRQVRGLWCRHRCT